MFKIDSRQLEACAGISTKNFADKLTRHLVSAVPEACAALGAAEIRRKIEAGIGRAASHGITVEKDVCRFVALGFALGEAFDENPKLSWVRDILGAENPLDPSAKVQQLWTVAESDFIPDEMSFGGNDVAEPSTAIAVELAEAARTELSSPLPVGNPVAPCPLRARFYPFSL